MKKNVLFVLPFLPYPLSSGGHQAIYNGIAIMKELANVYVVYAHTSWEDHSARDRHALEEMFPFVKIFHFALSEKTAGQFFFKLKRRLNRLSASLWKKIAPSKENVNDYRSWGFCAQPDNYAAYVNQLIREYNIDIVQVEMCFLLSMVLDLPEHVKKVFVHHELHYVREELRLSKINVPQSFRNDVTIHKFEEIGLLNLYDEIVVLSETDRQKLIQEGVRKPILASFAVVNTEKESIGNMDSWSHVLTFVGPESQDPNYDGIMWFLESCWPALLENDEDYKLRIIGNWSKNTQEKIMAQYKNVVFAGFVEHLNVALANSVMIVPIRVGSGIRMKILEAGSMGIPVVSTPVGAEGLPLVDDESILLAETPDGFVSCIKRMNDVALRQKLSRQLNQVVRERYSLSALCSNRKALYTMDNASNSFN